MQVGVGSRQMTVLSFEYHDSALVGVVNDPFFLESSLKIRDLLILLLLGFDLLLELGDLLFEASDLHVLLVKLSLKLEGIVII
jgi:hypothetical protein